MLYFSPSPALRVCNCAFLQQELARIIREVLQAQGEKVLERMMKEAALSQELLQLKIQAKTIARPTDTSVTSNQQKTKK